MLIKQKTKNKKNAILHHIHTPQNNLVFHLFLLLFVAYVVTSVNHNIYFREGQYKRGKCYLIISLQNPCCAFCLHNPHLPFSCTIRILVWSRVNLSFKQLAALTSQHLKITYNIVLHYHTILSSTSWIFRHQIDRISFSTCWPGDDLLNVSDLETEWLSMTFSSTQASSYKKLWGGKKHQWCWMGNLTMTGKIPFLVSLGKLLFFSRGWEGCNYIQTHSHWKYCGLSLTPPQSWILRGFTWRLSDTPRQASTPEAGPRRRDLMMEWGRTVLRQPARPQGLVLWHITFTVQQPGHSHETY